MSKEPERSLVVCRREPDRGILGGRTANGPVSPSSVVVFNMLCTALDRSEVVVVVAPTLSGLLPSGCAAL